MAIILLALISLLAPIVAGRPILPDSDHSAFVYTSSILLNALQAPFQIRSGRDVIKFDAVRFHPQERKQQIEGFSALDAESIATEASFGISPGVDPSLAGLVNEVADRQDAFDTDEFDNTRDSHVTDKPVSLEPVVDEQQDVPINQRSNAPLAVLAFSCVATFLALAGLVVMLYIVKSVSFQMLASKTAWELLPRFWKCPQSRADKGEITEKHLSGGGCLLLQTEVGQQRLLSTGEGSIRRHGPHMDDQLLYFYASSDIRSEWDEVDEKYQDALDVTPLPFLHDLPLTENEPHQSCDDLPLLSSYPLDRPTSDRSTPLICETSSPISRPAWSVRAIHTPALGLSSCDDESVDFIPHPLVYSRRRAYRHAVPEFDIALALQLRLGLGIGVDTAWMVRFLMAIFGWFAVAMTGNTR